MRIKNLFLSLSFFGFCTAVQADGTAKIARDRYCGRDTYFKAIKCCPSGTHLPTPREYAVRAQSMGARGILEMKDVSPGVRPDGYSMVSAKNPDGVVDMFWYSSEGYRPPPDAGTDDNWWTQSAHADVSVFYYFEEDTGKLNAHSQGWDWQIRCFGN